MCTQKSQAPEGTDSLRMFPHCAAGHSVGNEYSEFSSWEPLVWMSLVEDLVTLLIAHGGFPWNS